LDSLLHRHELEEEVVHHLNGHASEGCPELERIGARDYVFPESSDLVEDIAKIQAVKKSFLRKFWKVSGREIVREAAQQRLEAVSVFFAV